MTAATKPVTSPTYYLLRTFSVRRAVPTDNPEGKGQTVPVVVSEHPVMLADHFYRLLEKPGFGFREDDILVWKDMDPKKDERAVVLTPVAAFVTAKSPAA